MFCRPVLRGLRRPLWTRNLPRAATTSMKLPASLTRCFHDNGNGENSLLSRSCLDMGKNLFQTFENKNGKIPVAKLIAAVLGTGLRVDDPRFGKTMQNFENALHDDANEGYIDLEGFEKCIDQNIVLIDRALRGDFVIPEFKEFANHIKGIFFKCKGRKNEKVAEYIPQLARTDPNNWGVSVCTIDGQRVSYGDADEHFCLQSVAKALVYPIVLDVVSEDMLHKYVGLEPSGVSMYQMELDSKGKPFNPMIAAGALGLCSLLKPQETLADRCEFLSEKIKQCAGGEYVSISNSTFISERETADHNYSLGYNMKASDAFPPDTDLSDTFGLYFHMSSVEVTCESASVMAATLANGGICPLTGEKVLSSKAVQHTLSLMHSCGMFNYSGEFAFQVGLPAKAGGSGAIMVVVPNVCGFVMWSPPVDSAGISVRGLQFCKELVEVFNFHKYSIVRHTGKKLDPRLRVDEVHGQMLMDLIFAAANGDITALRRYKVSGANMSLQDYDGRSALHLAAAEGQLEVVRFLLVVCKVPADQKDRWNNTPLDEAMLFKQSECEDLIRHHLRSQGKLSQLNFVKEN